VVPNLHNTLVITSRAALRCNG